MMKQTLKTAVVLSTSAVAIPYAVTILAHMMYGWPEGRDKYRKALKALHPRKVYAVSYAVIQELNKVRFAYLCMQWNIFYKQAEPSRLLKDMLYGTNSNALDVYMPVDGEGQTLPGVKPVIVFLYGGTWSSGDKNQYGLLGCQLADRLRSLVVIPNYSIYPKGYVDDQVQDTVDCLAWIQDHIQDFGGDKSSVILLGHSAGAHLCMMSVLELTLKKLMHHPEAVLSSLTDPPIVSRQSSMLSEAFRFEDKHFNGSQASSHNGDTDQSGSFVVVTDKDEGSEGSVTDRGPSITLQMGAAGDAGGEAEEILQIEVTEAGDADPGEIPHVEIDGEMTQSQRDATDILASIKLVIGLSGVYHIADHYEHETWRGIEFISHMARAMYGPDHFDRLSPCLLVNELPEKIKLPPIVLVHGDKDKTVPLSSSLRLSQALWDKGCQDVSVSVLPGCPHIEICLDLMDPKRHWHHTVMEELEKATSKYL